MKAGLSIVAAGYAASGITGELAILQEEELSLRYNKEFVKNAKAVASKDEEIFRILLESKQEPGRIFRTESKGIYDTLWEIGEAFQSGLMIDAFKIPILTETVEVCELLDLDPFLVPARGTVFILTEMPVQIQNLLESHGFPSEIAGQLWENKARIVQIKDRTRFLTKPEKGKECIYACAPLAEPLPTETNEGGSYTL